MNRKDLFLGRENELQILQSAWSKIQPSDPETEAQLVVLLAESGLGKTRLVQEFYRWLSLNHDPATEGSPEGYWPDSFQSEQASLDVNPKFEKKHQSGTPIPWLWWGMRFARPGRRNSTGSRCGLSDSRLELVLHLKPLEAARKIERIKKEMIWTLASKLGSHVSERLPGVGLAFGVKDSVNDILSFSQDWKKEREFRRQIDQPLAESYTDELIKIENLAFDYFCSILDTNNREATTVPVVIFLDDAQWADAPSLRFIERLLVKARREHWPLMVVCTHWEKEWREQQSQPHCHVKDSHSLGEIVAKFKFESEGYTPWIQEQEVQPIDDLSMMVTTDLPGLTPLQQEQFLAKAGGNPLYLEEALDYFLDNTDFFVGENSREPLTADGIQALDELPSDLRRLVAKRFSQMEDAVKRALGWSSEQGQKFLTQITLACARSVDDSISEDSIRSSLRLAQRPYSQIKLLGDHGRFNRNEFRQAVFQEVANEYLRRRKFDRENVQQVIRETLSEWLTSGKIDDLPSAERLDALLMARHNLSAAKAEPEQIRHAWCLAMYRLAIHYRDQFLWDYACATAKEWIDAPSNGWDLNWIPIQSQLKIVDLLYGFNEFDLARLVIEPHLSELEQRFKEEPSELNSMNLFSVLDRINHIDDALGLNEDAGQGFLLCAKIIEYMADEFELTPEILSDLQHSLRKAGAYEKEIGCIDEAKNKFLRSLEISEQFVKEFGETPQSLNDLAKSLKTLGQFELIDKGLTAEAGERFLLALKKSKKSVELCETPQSLCDLASSYFWVGQYEEKRNEIEEAREMYRCALAESKKSVDKFGETPYSLEGFNTQLLYLVVFEDAYGERGDSYEISREYLESLKRIVEKFGETSRRTHKLSWVYRFIGKYKHEQSDTQEAREMYSRALSESENSIAKFGMTLESLNDSALSLKGLSVIEYGAGEKEVAYELLKERLKFVKQIVNKFGETPESLRRVADSLAILSEREFELERLDEVSETLLNRLKVNKQIVNKFGETSESRRELSDTFFELSKCQGKLGKTDLALISAEKALEITRQGDCTECEIKVMKETISMLRSNLIGSAEMKDNLNDLAGSKFRRKERKKRNKRLPRRKK